MFAFYTFTTIGLSWLDNSTAGLFLDKFGADKLPFVYVGNALIGATLGFAYSWVQRTISLRRVMVATPMAIALPLVLFRFGLGIEHLATATIFVMRLWLDVTYVLNDINTSITANQLFNIREIKRTYPIISSGVLVADVISGFSLPLLLEVVGLESVLLLSAASIAVGSLILAYLGRTYRQAFPDSPTRYFEEDQSDFSANRRVQGPLRNYVFWLVAFFVLAQVLLLLVEFQFLDQVELQNADIEDKASAVASFLGLFNGILGIAELTAQWLLSSRAIERLGLFRAAAIQPAVIVVVGLGSTLGVINFSGLDQFTGGMSTLYLGAIAIKFSDELLRYTLFASANPVFFQPVPENVRGSIQARVRGGFESLSTGGAGLLILGTTWVCQQLIPDNYREFQSWVVVGQIVLMAALWLWSVWALRSRYVSLLVLSAERGRLGAMDVDSGTLKLAVVEALEQDGTTPEDKRSCIELLSRIDPDNVSEVLAPLLTSLTPPLQRQSLDVMLQQPSEEYLVQVRALIVQQPPPEVLAVALRYLWLTESEQDVRHLQPYLRSEVDPTVRGTAASLIMRRGTPGQKAEATNCLRRMLTSGSVQERVMGCRALGEADYLQALRLHIPNLLQDDSLEVRCALLEVIASARLEEYYPSLVRGLSYKATRESALKGLGKLGNEALPMLAEVAQDVRKPDIMRTHACTAIGQVGTAAALDALVANLFTSWGTARRNILKILLKIPDEVGIEGVLDRIGRTGLETLINQELMLIGQRCAALLDLRESRVPGEQGDLLRKALNEGISDGQEQLFLLMKFLYPLGAVQAAAFNIRSGTGDSKARGLEILDNTLDIPSKRSVLNLLDADSPLEKLRSLSDLMEYQSMAPRDRIRRLLNLRHFLSAWPLACCFHLARTERWSLTTDQTLACLRHPRGFVREAVLSYLKVASQRALVELLPRLQNDPDPLVSAQVGQMSQEFGLSSEE
ncbi:MAG: Npt1/Npt2 family nucleotide transporter [Cyanobacteria bacterium P01_D01_bin.73]